MILSPWLGMLLVVAVFALLMATLRGVQRRWSPHPELTRKAFHVSMGLFTLTLPAIFAESWPVFVMAGGTVAALVAIRTIRPLREQFGRIIGGVDRFSLGEIYFAVSVAVLFHLSADNRLLFVIPMLILTLADATAALIGIRYGQVRFQGAVGGFKSAEGSVAFFLVAFLSTHVPLLLLSDTGRAESLLIATVVGFLVMIFEAIAWRGLDNLFIPLCGFVLLKIYLTLSVRDLVTRLVVAALMVAFVYGYRRWTTLNETGMLGAILIGYLCWALGGWQWFVAPMTLFVSYTLLSPRNEANSRRVHNIHAVLSVSSVSLIWLFLERSLDRPWMFLPYTLAFAVHLAIAGIARLKCDYPKMGTATILTTCVLKGWALVFVPYAAMGRFTREATIGAAVGLAGVCLASVAFYLAQPGMEDCPTDGPRWWRQAVASAVGSVVAIVALFV